MCRRGQPCIYHCKIHVSPHHNIQSGYFSTLTFLWQHCLVGWFIFKIAVYEITLVWKFTSGLTLFLGYTLAYGCCLLLLFVCWLRLLLLFKYLWIVVFLFHSPYHDKINYSPCIWLESRKKKRLYSTLLMATHVATS